MMKPFSHLSGMKFNDSNSKADHAKRPNPLHVCSEHLLLMKCSVTPTICPF